MNFVTKAEMIASVLKGDVIVIEQIPDAMPLKDPSIDLDEDDEFAFLTEHEFANERIKAVDQIMDDRGFNLLDLISEKVVAGRQQGLAMDYLATVTLHLIVKKGAWVSDATLSFLYEPHQRASFGRHLRRVHRFRRTIGLFSHAAFSFDDLEQHSVPQAQGWATRRLYGIAHVIHDDLYSTSIAGSCAMLHPAFLGLLEGARTVRDFARDMAEERVMMNSIRDNHAHRFLTTLLKTPGFEAAVRRCSQQDSERCEAVNLARSCVLLAEDMHCQRASLTQFFASRNMQVLVAHDGAEAFELFRRHHSDIDLVVTDFGMPLMDGLNLSIKIRSLDKRIPIIMQTTPPIHPDLRQEVNRFGVCLIPKFDESLLLRSLHEAMRRQVGEPCSTGQGGLA